MVKQTQVLGADYSKDHLPPSNQGRRRSASKDRGFRNSMENVSHNGDTEDVSIMGLTGPKQGVSKAQVSQKVFQIIKVCSPCSSFLP